MEQIKVISMILPFGTILAIESTDYMDELNSSLRNWVNSAKPKSYRIINIAVQEVTYDQAMLYAMFIAYE